jgi:hypothetical protein
MFNTAKHTEAQKWFHYEKQCSDKEIIFADLTRFMPMRLKTTY